MTKRINKKVKRLLSGVLISGAVMASSQGVKVLANQKQDSAETISGNTQAKAITSREVKTGVINTNSTKALNVRSGAGTSYSIIGSVKNGEEVQVQEVLNGWCKIRYGSSYGYISSEYVKISSSTSNSSQETSTATTVKYTGVTTSGLNVRKGGSTTYDKIGYLQKDAIVQITAKLDNGWYKIKYENTYGYISGLYVENVKSVESNISSATTVKYTATVNVSVNDTLNVRSGAGASYRILGALNKGTKVEIVDKMSNGWSKIKYNSSYGYVNTSYLSNITSVSSTETVIKTGTVNTASLNVRSGPSTSDAKIGSLSQNTKVEIVSSTNGWYKIKYGTGYGYVSATYINIGAAGNTGNTDSVQNLEETLFVGDSFTVLLSNTIKAKTNNNVYIHAKSGSMPSYWLDKVSSMPANSKVKRVVLLIGVNGAGYESNKTDVKTLINKLSAKYPDKTIYVQKIFPVGKNFKSANPTTFNQKINTLNGVIKSHCATVKNATFIDTTSGFVDSNGYLLHTDDGLHIKSSYNNQFYSNIEKAVKAAAK